jgi:hypothetical protein
MHEKTFTATISLSEQGDHIKVTLTPEELEALPTKIVPVPQ